ncbi:MAG: M16 family metallopeptidase, partial [Acidiferrobacterales bacterium]
MNLTSALHMWNVHLPYPIRSVQWNLGVLLAVLLTAPTAIEASEYAPPGLYDVKYITLENGFDVVFKKRSHAHNVAVRLIVGVGHRHFPCDKRETAHFLEHLLFTGTSKHTETELDRLIEDHGGNWNASTELTQTQYQIDMFDRHLALAIETLFEIITDTIITAEKIELTRDIIHRELGGKTSALRRWLYERGVGKSAVSKVYEALLPGTAVVCPGLDSPEGVSESDIRQAYTRYYIPNNMSLIVVGNFDEQMLLAHVRRTFAELPSSVSKPPLVATPPYPAAPREFTGTLAPLLDAGGTIGFAYRTEGASSPDLYALWVLNVYLDRVLYEKIRVAAGLSYSPEAFYLSEIDYGVFAATADAELDQLGDVTNMIGEELETLRRSAPTDADIEVAKQRILLARVQGYESNAEVADYYVTNLHELKKQGRLLDHEAVIAALTSADIHRVIKKYLRRDRQMIMRSLPTLTYTQFYIALGFLIALVLG